MTTVIIPHVLSSPRFLFTPVALLCCILGAATALGAQAEKMITASFDWRIDDPSYQFDSGTHFLNPLPSLDALRDTGWGVTLDGCSTNDTDLETVTASFFWDIELPTGTQHVKSDDCFFEFTFPKQGVYKVTLTVTGVNRSHTSLLTGSISKYVTIRRILIVTMGDSIASGEGNPDIALGYYYDELSRPFDRLYGPVWANRQCHRSAYSGPAQAANLLQIPNWQQAIASVQRTIPDKALQGFLYDSHYAVTFLSVACSGAGIKEGVLGSYSGIEKGYPDLDPQIEQVAALLCPKPIEQIFATGGCTRDELPNIDALLLVVGANDAGFGDVVTACANPFTECSDDVKFTSRIKNNIASLPNLYAALYENLRDRLRVSGVYIAEYPDPTHDENGNLCNAMIFEDALVDNFGFIQGVDPTGNFRDGVIDSREISWAEDNVILPLNEKVRFIARVFNWTLVGQPEPLSKRGYCTGYGGHLDDSRLINTYADSKRLQGDPEGTLHPDYYGQFIYGTHFAAALEPIRAKVAAARGDINADGDVDRDDLEILLQDLGKPVSQSACGAWCDLNGDGQISILDARELILLCSRPQCATTGPGVLMRQ
jgi:hypothetical protein